MPPSYARIMTNADKARPATVGRKKSKVVKGVIVLGMHRSGTSACTRVLNLLGCALPAELIAAGDGNETGHWEAVDAVDLNDEMLASAGSRWDDWGPINDDWHNSPLRDEMVDRASELVLSHAKLGPLFVLKDPRICRLADVWLAAMQRSRVQPLIIQMIRNPVEVAESLESRDLMSQGYGRLLWLRHVLDAEFLTRGQQRVFCTYDQLLENWYGVLDQIKAGLNIAFPRNSPHVHAEIDEFLDGHHRHHSSNPEATITNSALPSWLRRTYAIMHSWGQHGEAKSDHSELDAIRIEFDQSYHAFARLLIDRDVAGQVGSGSELKRQLVAELSQAQDTVHSAQAAIEEAEARLAAQAAYEVESTKQLQAYADQAERHSAEIARLQAALADSSRIASEIDAVRQREIGLVDEVATLTQAALTADSKIDHLQAEVVRLANEAETLTLAAAEAMDLKRREAELAAEIAALRDVANVSASETQRLQAAIAELTSKATEFDVVAVQVSALEAELEEALSREAASEREVQKLRDDARTSADKMLALESEVDRLKVDAHEIARLKASLEEAQSSLAKEMKEAGDARAALASKSAALDNQQERNAELKGKLSVALSTAAQRDEELAQVWKQLLTAERAAGVEDRKLLEESEKRALAEMRLAKTENDLVILRAEHTEACEMSARLSEQMATEVAFLTRVLREQAGAADAAESAQDALLNANLTVEKLRDELRQAQDEARMAKSSRISAEREFVQSLDEAARFSKLLSEDSQAKAGWLREFTRVSERFPKWWALLPAPWRRKLEQRRYLRNQLFDADQYLANNPDVAQFGMDPIRHYILHGIDEGRTWER